MAALPINAGTHKKRHFEAKASHPKMPPKQGVRTCAVDRAPQQKPLFYCVAVLRLQSDLAVAAPHGRKS
jgi:hypothetical protein